MSSYIKNRAPGMYGGDQKLWLAHVRATASKTATEMHRAVEGKEDIEALFHQVFASLSTTRKEYAGSVNDKNYQKFGIRRDQEENFPGPFGLTALFNPYDEYGDKLLTVFQKHLGGMRHTLKEFQETEKTVHGESFFGKSSYMQFKIFSGQEMNNSYIQPTPKEILRLSGLCKVPATAMPSEITSFDFLIENKQYMETLKSASPEDYKKLKMLHIVPEMIKTFPKWKKSDFILVTLRAEIDTAENGQTKQMFPLSQYITWAYRDFKEDPVEHMRSPDDNGAVVTRSIITIIHQDPFLIKPMLAKCAKIFKDVIQWDKKEIQALKDQVAHFLIYMSHAMPNLRGSGSICDELEIALYEYHGYKLTYNDSKWTNLEALTSFPHEFIANYNSMIHLEKLSEKPPEVLTD